MLWCVTSSSQVCSCFNRRAGVTHKSDKYFILVLKRVFFSEWKRTIMNDYGCMGTNNWHKAFSSYKQDGTCHQPGVNLGNISAIWGRPRCGLETSKARIYSPQFSWQEVHDFCSKRFCWRIQISSSSFSSCLQSKSSFLFSFFFIRPCSTHTPTHTCTDARTHMCTRLSYSHEITSSCRWWLIFCPRCNRIWQRGHETFGRTGCGGCHCAGPHSARGGTPC